MPPRNEISLIGECCRLYFDVGLSQNKIADSLQLGRSTLGNYFNKLNGLLLSWEEINKLSSNELEQKLFGIPHSKFSQEMNSYFQTIFKMVDEGKTTIKEAWSLHTVDQSTKGIRILSRSNFYHNFKCWRKTNNLNNIFLSKWKITITSEKDNIQLKKWYRSNDKRKWAKAVAILGATKGIPISEIEKKIERSRRKIIRWIRAFREKGIAGLSNDNKSIRPEIATRMLQKKECLLKLIHQPPSAFGINRTSWCLEDLSSVYKKEYGMPFSRSSVSTYIDKAGFSFKKAKKVLTSTDPLS